MEAVVQALASLRLERYARAFEELGWDDLEHMRTLDDEEIRGLVNDVGMKPGHASKFNQFLRRTGGREGSALGGSGRPAAWYGGGDFVGHPHHPAASASTPLLRDPVAAWEDGLGYDVHGGPPPDATHGVFGRGLAGSSPPTLAGYSPLLVHAAAGEPVALEQGAFLPADLLAQSAEGSDLDARGPDLRSPPMRCPHMKIPFGLDQVIKESRQEQRPAASQSASPHALMICNIPCSVTRQQLEEAVDLMGFSGEYDYLYLPEKRRSRKVESAGRTSNPGYGFISFPSSRKGEEFVKRFTGYRFPGTSSLKVCEVRRARRQCAATLQGQAWECKAPPGLGQPSAPSGADDEGLDRWGPVPLSASHLAMRSAPGHVSQALPVGLLGPSSQWAEPRWSAGTEADHTTAGATTPGRSGEQIEFGDWWCAAELDADSSRHAEQATEAERRGCGASSGEQEPDSVPSSSVQHGSITALMVCNVPCSVSQQQLSEAVDSMGFAGKYDFLYLPVKGRPSKSGQSVRRSNLGYGFIDFSCPRDAQKFIESFTGYQFAGTTSVKRCEVRAAHLQGSAGHQTAVRAPSSADRPWPAACGAAGSVAASASA